MGDCVWRTSPDETSNGVPLLDPSNIRPSLLYHAYKVATKNRVVAKHVAIEGLHWMILTRFSPLENVTCRQLDSALHERSSQGPGVLAEWASESTAWSICRPFEREQCKWSAA